ncbi:MAG TPA: hypothetical protein PLP57_06500 [Candidatus Saccharicenans sp.]|jgi:hypothetical protein|nr:APC family permease [Candidatus Saccharicenans sp.]HRD02276.1 hypothetical protein [Candidatus Saccharicenans sp.]
MKGTENKRQAIIYGVVMLAVFGFTVGIFLMFVPDSPRYSYWIAMGDISLMVIFAGTYLIYDLLLSTRKVRSKIPIAMHIGIGTTVGIFFLVSIAIVMTFLFAFNRSNLDGIFLWVVIGKWLLLLLVISPMWLTVQQGEDESVSQVQSEGERVAMVSILEQALAELRRLRTSSEKGTLEWHVVDELETLRNQIRSRVSQRAVTDAKNETLSKLIDELTNIVSEIGHSSENERKATLMCVQDAISKISREVANL